ncbi:hypothetical protein [Deinococcus sp. ME38]|uniref:hypothetical protein n=1 Tax=Deinococcus sp. ME38 TaxID=3400344 RepID=UPI003B599707
MRPAPPAATRDLLRLLDQPDQLPIARASLITLVVVVVVDTLTPASLPLAVVLAPLLLASLIARSEPLTARLTALAVLGSAAVSVLDVLRSGPDPQMILLHLSATALVTTGIWAMWQARQSAAAPAGPPPLPVPDADVPPVERAAQMLAYRACHGRQFPPRRNGDNDVPTDVSPSPRPHDVEWHTTPTGVETLGLQDGENPRPVCLGSVKCMGSGVHSGQSPGVPCPRVAGG